MEQYAIWLGIGAIAFLSLFLLAAHFYRHNARLRLKNLEAEELNRDLEARVRERTAEISMLLEHVQDLLNSTAEAIFGLDAEGRCSFANPACVRMLGYSEAEDLVGQNMHRLIHHKHPDGSPYPETECPISGVFLSGEGAHLSHEVFWRADGSSFPVEYWSYPIRRDNQITGAVVTFLDISKRKQAEQNLRRAQKMEAIGQLTGGIAHDFNNILGIILGHLTLLKPKLGGEELKHLGLIEKSARRAADLTKQLLGFSRTTAASVLATDINRVMEEMGVLLDHTLGTGISVERRQAEGLWLTEIDPGDFQDCLLNLIINARDAMPDGGKVILETRNTTLSRADCAQDSKSVPGDYVLLTISDNGIGMSPEQTEHIFEPFFTTKPKEKGTGLGLAMVYGFIQRSNGLIRVDSEPGGGSRFSLYLPRTEAPAQAAGTEQQEIESTSTLQGKETILVVDDEAGLLELAQLSLESLGYRVLTASNGREALQHLNRDQPIDLLFSDVVMPSGLNGFELAERALAKRPALKILLTSGYSAKASPIKGREDLVKRMLPKPYSQKELAERIRILLRQ